MIERAYYGTLPTGESVDQYTLTNRNGATLKAITYGGIVTNLLVPDMHGRLQDVVLGFDHLEGYIQDITYQGAIVGRFANRIAEGRIELDGKEWQLTQNEGKHHLHGGFRPWSKKIWQATPLDTEEGPALQLALTSPDGEEGFPGEVHIQVTYTWTHDQIFRIEYEATTSAPTVLNVTHHAYFHLGGALGIGDHRLILQAGTFVEIDALGISTGKLADVTHTPLDFTSLKRIGDALNDPHVEIERRKGLDFCYVLDHPEGNSQPDAVLYEAHTGRRMDVYTTEPGVQVYTSNFLNITGKNDQFFGKHSAVCLEAQHFPNSPNHPNFPGTVLRPGETYRQRTEYRFGSGMLAGF